MYYRQQLELCLKPRAVRPFVWWSVFSPPSSRPAIYQHVDKSLIKPLHVKWFPVDPCGWDHAHYLSILHCLLCHPHIHERCARRSSFVIIWLGSAGVPPRCSTVGTLFVCVTSRFSSQPSGEARTSAGTQKWHHLPRYSQYNLSLLFYLQYSYPSSIINCLPVVYLISSVYFASYHFYSCLLSISSPPPPFFFNIELFPIKIAVIKWWDLIFLGF